MLLTKDSLGSWRPYEYDIKPWIQLAQLKLEREKMLLDKQGSFKDVFDDNKSLDAIYGLQDSEDPFKQSLWKQYVNTENKKRAITNEIAKGINPTQFSKQIQDIKTETKKQQFALAAITARDNLQADYNNNNSNFIYSEIPEKVGYDRIVQNWTPFKISIKNVQDEATKAGKAISGSVTNDEFNAYNQYKINQISERGVKYEDLQKMLANGDFDEVLNNIRSRVGYDKIIDEREKDRLDKIIVSAFMNGFSYKTSSKLTSNGTPSRGSGRSRSASFTPGVENASGQTPATPNNTSTKKQNKKVTATATENFKIEIINSEGTKIKPDITFKKYSDGTYKLFNGNREIKDPKILNNKTVQQILNKYGFKEGGVLNKYAEGDVIETEDDNVNGDETIKIGDVDYTIDELSNGILNSYKENYNGKRANIDDILRKSLTAVDLEGKTVDVINSLQENKYVALHELGELFRNYSDEGLLKWVSKNSNEQKYIRQLSDEGRDGELYELLKNKLFKREKNIDQSGLAQYFYDRMDAVKNAIEENNDLQNAIGKLKKYLKKNIFTLTKDPLEIDENDYLYPIVRGQYTHPDMNMYTGRGTWAWTTGLDDKLNNVLEGNYHDPSLNKWGDIADSEKASTEELSKKSRDARIRRDYNERKIIEKFGSGPSQGITTDTNFLFQQPYMMKDTTDWIKANDPTGTAVSSIDIPIIVNNKVGYGNSTLIPLWKNTPREVERYSAGDWADNNVFDVRKKIWPWNKGISLKLNMRRLIENETGLNLDSRFEIGNGKEGKGWNKEKWYIGDNDKLLDPEEFNKRLLTYSLNHMKKDFYLKINDGSDDNKRKAAITQDTDESKNNHYKLTEREISLVWQKLRYENRAEKNILGDRNHMVYVPDFRNGSDQKKLYDKIKSLAPKTDRNGVQSGNKDRFIRAINDLYNVVNQNDEDIKSGVMVAAGRYHNMYQTAVKTGWYDHVRNKGQQMTSKDIEQLYTLPAQRDSNSKQLFGNLSNIENQQLLAIPVTSNQDNNLINIPKSTDRAAVSNTYKYIISATLSAFMGGSNVPVYIWGKDNDDKIIRPEMDTSEDENGYSRLIMPADSAEKVKKALEGKKLKNLGKIEYYPEINSLVFNVTFNGSGDDITEEKYFRVGIPLQVFCAENNSSNTADYVSKIDGLRNEMAFYYYYLRKKQAQRRDYEAQKKSVNQDGKADLDKKISILGGDIIGLERVIKNQKFEIEDLIKEYIIKIGNPGVNPKQPKIAEALKKLLDEAEAETETGDE